MSDAPIEDNFLTEEEAAQLVEELLSRPTKYFAELDDLNVVVRVECVNPEDCFDADGNHSESVGVAFLRSLFGDKTYRECFYDGTRGAMPGSEWNYLPDLDQYRPPKPDHPDAVWDDASHSWLTPDFLLDIPPMTINE